MPAQDTQEEPKATILGAITADEAKALHYARTRDGKIDTTDDMGQLATATLSRLGAMGVRGELAVAPARTIGDDRELPVGYIDLNLGDLGTSLPEFVGDGQVNPEIAHLPAAAEALQALTQHPSQ